jgi:hypothetical protein
MAVELEQGQVHEVDHLNQKPLLKVAQLAKE